MAAREILRFIRSGGRFREATVLVRKLNDYVSRCNRSLPDFRSRSSWIDESRSRTIPCRS
jgi:hypothetical protein